MNEFTKKFWNLVSLNCNLYAKELELQFKIAIMLNYKFEFQKSSIA